MVKYMEFDWDASKEVKNVLKHGITFEEAVETFFDSNGIKLIDLGHSQVESRFFWVCKTKKGKILTTWYTKRGKIVRIIGSAQWRKFRRIYYETTKIR